MVQLLLRYKFTMSKGHEDRTYGRTIALNVKDGMIMDVTPVDSA